LTRRSRSSEHQLDKAVALQRLQRVAKRRKIHHHRLGKQLQRRRPADLDLRQQAYCVILSPLGASTSL
jgi:hypothetical protein